MDSLNYKTIWDSTPPPERLNILPADEQLAAGAQWFEMDEALRTKVMENIDQLEIN